MDSEGHTPFSRPSAHSPVLGPPGLTSLAAAARHLPAHNPAAGEHRRSGRVPA